MKRTTKDKTVLVKKDNLNNYNCTFAAWELDCYGHTIIYYGAYLLPSTMINMCVFILHSLLGVACVALKKGGAQSGN